MNTHWCYKNKIQPLSKNIVDSFSNSGPNQLNFFMLRVESYDALVEEPVSLMHYASPNFSCIWF